MTVISNGSLITWTGEMDKFDVFERTYKINRKLYGIITILQRCPNKFNRRVTLLIKKMSTLAMSVTLLKQQNKSSELHR